MGSASATFSWLDAQASKESRKELGLSTEDWEGLLRDVALGRARLIYKNQGYGPRGVPIKKVVGYEYLDSRPYTAAEKAAIASGSLLGLGGMYGAGGAAVKAIPAAGKAVSAAGRLVNLLSDGRISGKLVEGVLSAQLVDTAVLGSKAVAEGLEEGQSGGNILRELGETELKGLIFITLLPILGKGGQLILNKVLKGKGITRAEGEALSEELAGVGKKQVVQTESISYGDLDYLPRQTKLSYEKYESNGWKGNFSGQTSGTAAGSKYINLDKRLPQIDYQGNPITYREFDVNNKLLNTRRDAIRFIKGSDGTIYYTDDHYNTFVRIK